MKGGDGKVKKRSCPLTLSSPLWGEDEDEGETPRLLGADTPLKEGNVFTHRKCSREECEVKSEG